jgi:site-specific recombinase XerC
VCELSTLISDYLDFRAARGFQPNRKTEHLLTQFANTLPAERDDGLLFSRGEALAWAHAPVGGHPAWLSARLSTVRGFAIYLAGSGLPVGVPAVRQGVGGSHRATPYLYSFNDIRALMTTAHQVFTPLRAATMTTLIGLLAVTGMRIGETVRLTIGDVDLDQGVVLIAHAKFGRQRMVRLDPSSCDALAGYLSGPDRQPVQHRTRERRVRHAERHRAQRAHRSRCISPAGAPRWSAGPGRCPPTSARLCRPVRYADVGVVVAVA